MVQNLGIKLPVPAPNAPRFISLEDTSSIVDSLVELEASAHWLLGTDYPTYADLVSGQQLTTTGSVTLGANKATCGAGISQLSTPFDDLVEGTVCLVFKNEGLRAYGAIMGDWDDTAHLHYIIWTNASGYFLQMSAAADPDGTYSSVGLTPLPTGLADNDWTFMAIAWDSSAHIYWGDKSYSLAVQKWVTAGKKLHFGTIHAQADGGEVAEIIVFDRALTSGEVSAVRSRSISRMSDRGLTVE